MEFFTILNFILTIYILFQLSSLKKQRESEGSANNLQDKKEFWEANAQQVAQTTPSANVSKIDIQTEQQLSSATPQYKDIFADDPLTNAINWLREDWMLKLGGFFILLSVGWFVTFAFMNNWIGETGRIVLGILSGAGFMVWGVKRMKKVMREGEIILIVGATILVTSLFAGQHLYHLYPDTLSLFAMTFVAIAIAAIAYLNKREVLAVMGVLLIGVSPILAGYDSVTPNVTGLLTYLLFMTAGVLWLSKVTGWRSVIFLSTLVVFVYFAPYCIKYKSYTLIQSIPSSYMLEHAYSPPPLGVDVDVLRFFAIIFAIIFNMSTFMTLLFDKIAKRDDFILVAAGGIFTAFCLNTLSSPDLLAIKVAIIAILYMGLAIALTKLTKYSYYVELYSTISILLLMWATSIVSIINFLPAALSIEAISVTLFYKYVFGHPFPIVSLIFYGGAYFLNFIFIADVGRTWSSTISFFTTLASTYFPYLLIKKDASTKSYDRAGTVEFISLFFGNILGSIGLYSLIENVSSPLRFSSEVVRGIRYSIYAIIGSLLYFISRREGSSKQKYWFGLVFIGYVVASLLLYEVWRMDIAARIVVFFAIGLLFISSIYFLKIYEKKK
ncbi:MAG: DUF2339 domain-containing protein [Patescibacteria group bacterium]